LTPNTVYSRARKFPGLAAVFHLHCRLTPHIAKQV
jgi:hypothetical protein